MRHHRLLGPVAIVLPLMTGSPASSQPVAPAAAPADPAEIVVTGTRSSLRSSQALKRNAEGIVDAIVAEDIGKLPDVSASAALARVPGIQVQRAAGEAAQVQIRGLPDISTTYNGREIFTAEGRFVAIQDFPAGAVAALEVYKSNTAERIEGGIAGQINVRSRRPFDFEGFALSGALNGVHFEQSQALDWNGALLVSNRWDTAIGEIGVLLNASMTNINFLDATREQSGVIATAGAGQGTPPGVRFPDAVALFYGRGDRQRPSVNVALQWKPVPELEIYADGLFQGFRSRESDRFFFVPMFGDGLALGNIALDPDGRRVRSLTAAGGNRPDGYQSSLDARTDTYQAAGGAIYSGERVKLSTDVAYTDSRFRSDQANIDFALTGAPVRDVTFDAASGRGGPAFTMRDVDLTDPANFLFRGLFDRRFAAVGTDIQGRGDLEWQTGLDWLPRLQIGGRINDRDATRRNGQRYADQLGRGIGFSALPVELATIEPGFRFDDVQRQRVFVAPVGDSIRQNIDALRTLAGFPTGRSAFAEVEAFAANERAYAVYGQAKYAFDLGLPVDGVVGVRAVRTRTTVAGTTRDTAGGGETFTPVAQSSRYTDVLPNASARVELTDKLQFRLAYTETRTRPNFDQLNPSLIIAPESGGFRTATGGNPDLQPIQSINYDASLEYYFAPTGALTVGLFRRDVQGFISNVEVAVTDPVYGDLRINRPENGGGGRLQGVEAAFTSFFDFLPDWAKGFGVQANYTYVDGKSEVPAALAATLPGRQPVPGVSKHAFNIVGLYERAEFSARLAYNFRSDWVVEYQRIPAGDATRPLEQDSLGTLDFSTTITPVEAVTVAFDVLNILGTPIRTYRAFDDVSDAFTRQIKYLERVYSLGVRFRF